MNREVNRISPHNAVSRIRIAGVASALPEHRYPQAVITAALKLHWNGSLERPELLDRLHARARVEYRHLAFPLEQYARFGNWGETNSAWLEIAPELGMRAIDGALAMTVLTATGDASNGTLALNLTATDLSVTLPRGVATLNGTWARTVSVSTGTDGVTLLSGHLTAPSLTLTTHYNTRASSFTLSAVDLQRTLTLAGGVPQSSTCSGTHTSSSSRPGGSGDHSSRLSAYSAPLTPTALSHAASRIRS